MYYLFEVSILILYRLGYNGVCIDCCSCCAFFFQCLMLKKIWLLCFSQSLRRSISHLFLFDTGFKVKPWFPHVNPSSIIYSSSEVQVRCKSIQKTFEFSVLVKSRSIDHFLIWHWLQSETLVSPCKPLELFIVVVKFKLDMQIYPNKSCLSRSYTSTIKLHCFDTNTEKWGCLWWGCRPIIINAASFQINWLNPMLHGFRCGYWVCVCLIVWSYKY